MKKKFVLLFPLLGSCLLAGCNLNIYDIIGSSQTTSHTEKQASDLSSIKQGKLLYGLQMNNDFIGGEIAAGYKLDYRTIGDVPYVSMNSLSTILGPENSKISVNVNNDIYTYNIVTPSNVTYPMTIDSVKDTISFDDYDKFTTMIINYNQVNGISTLAESGAKGKTSYLKYSATNPTEYTAGKATTFDLKGHSLDVIGYDKKDVYIPFAVASDLFLESLGMPFAYNGDDFYVVNSDMFLKPGTKDTFSTYGYDFYHGSLTKKSRSADYSLFNYNSLCFKIDYFYGFADKDVAPLDTYLSSSAVSKAHPSLKKNLKSSDNDTYQAAVNELFFGLLGDGHTGVKSFSSIFGDGNNNIDTNVYSDRFLTLSRNASELSAIRKSHLGDSISAFTTYSKTAIIRFDAFVSNYMSDFNPRTISNYVSLDSFAMFYTYMKKIESIDTIENVVIDLSLNGGGAADACIALLGFLTNDVKINSYCPLTGSKTTLHYSVDTNLDGNFNVKDVKTNYKFYVLTSNYSFSCANLFPTVCKENGLAKIIGEKSGGGACVVRSTTTADGIACQMSGISRLCTKQADGSFKDNDDGIQPDYTLERAYFYDNKSLATFVESK